MAGNKGREASGSKALQGLGSMEFILRLENLSQGINNLVCVFEK